MDAVGGVIGVGFYFSTLARFACPRSRQLMHIYARFSRFAIVPEKKKCISCNVCTSVCHQGIDVMSFANKGRPMQDPSACVVRRASTRARRACQFGQVAGDGTIVSLDSLMASPAGERTRANKRAVRGTHQ